MWIPVAFLSRVRLDLKAVIVSGLFLFLVIASSATYLWLHASSSSCAGEFDLAIIGGEIIDGLGGPAFRADLGIRDKHIVCIGTINISQAAQVIDATGLSVAPGFIDVHTHVERNVPTRAGPFLAPNFVRQGVTTIITGNCGRSFLDLGKAFDQLEANGTEVNIASFIGHNTIRQHVMSDSAAAPSAEQLAKMKGLIGAAMKDGALGLSTGLEYIPGAFAKTDEIAELARVVRAGEGIYVSHIRNEGAEGFAAIAEAISIGQRTGVHVHISHFKAEGPNQWGSAMARLSLVKAAKDKGLIVSLDQYPYTASSTTIAVLLPSWVSSGGTAGVKERLRDSSTHERVRREMLEKLSQAGWSDYSFARVSYCGFNHSVVGLTIPEITQRHALVRPHPNDPRPINASLDATGDTRETNLERQADTVIDLFIHGDAQMVFFNMNEADVETIMLDPDVMFGSDSGVRDESSEALPHPRGLGTFPRVLGLFARDKHLFSMEEAVRRMTSLAAQTFGLISRGQITEGYYADVVVFDRHRVIDTATYERPLNSPQGIYYVVVNGALVLDHESPTKAQPGMVLRRGS
jgi:N-acyl-D-amino-acid deacylase